MKYQKHVFESFVMIMQFGLNMIVPILLCTMFGVWLGKKTDLPILMVPFFLVGALAGFGNCYRMAKKIYEQKGERDTKDVKKD